MRLGLGGRIFVEAERILEFIALNCRHELKLLGRAERQTLGRFHLIAFQFIRQDIEILVDLDVYIV